MDAWAVLVVSSCLDPWTAKLLMVVVPKEGHHRVSMATTTVARGRANEKYAR